MAYNSHKNLTPMQKALLGDAIGNPIVMKYYKNLYNRFKVELNTNNDNKVVNAIHKYLADPKNLLKIKEYQYQKY